MRNLHISSGDIWHFIPPNINCTLTWPGTGMVVRNAKTDRWAVINQEELINSGRYKDVLTMDEIFVIELDDINFNFHRMHIHLSDLITKIALISTILNLDDESVMCNIILKSNFLETRNTKDFIL